MSQQHKRYLQLADAATNPRDKLFYKLMADLGPTVNKMARAEINQVGAALMYEVVIRATASVVMELVFNLGITDLDKVAENFRTMLGNAAASQQVLGVVPVTPKLDS